MRLFERSVILENFLVVRGLTEIFPKNILLTWLICVGQGIQKNYQQNSTPAADKNRNTHQGTNRDSIATLCHPRIYIEARAKSPQILRQLQRRQISFVVAFLSQSCDQQILSRPFFVSIHNIRGDYWYDSSHADSTETQT